MQHEIALQLSNGRYPYKISENYETYFVPVVACTYANAMPMMSISLFGEANFFFGSDASYLANMRKWAIGVPSLERPIATRCVALAVTSQSNAR